MSNLVKILLVIGVVAVVASASFVVYTLPHWWWHVGSAKASTQRDRGADFAIFKSIRGELLLVDPDGGGLNIVYPSSEEFHFLGFVAFSNEAPISVVRSSNKIKVENGMQIIANGSKSNSRLSVGIA